MNELHTRVHLAIRRQDEQQLRRRLVVVGLLAILAIAAGLWVAVNI